MQRYNSSVIGKKSTVSTSSAKGIFSINNLADEQRNDNWPTVALPTFNMEILLVGGGGSGGKAAFTDYGSSGGGGGGVILSGTYTYTGGTQLDIVVGAGGAAITGDNTVRSDGNNGNASSIQVNGAGSTYISLARGGGGGGGGAQNANVVGLDGANGGGGYASGGTDDPGMGYGVNGTEVAGYHGEGTIGDFAGGAGGGAGGNASSGTGGIGTNAYSTWATATSTGDSGYYGGGGAAARYSDGGSLSGGSGGGGDGSFTSTNVWTGQNGTANTGGGGAGGGGRNGTGPSGAGGSGLVIIRYSGAAKNSDGNSNVTTGGYTYHVYTASGTFQV